MCGNLTTIDLPTRPFNHERIMIKTRIPKGVTHPCPTPCQVLTLGYNHSSPA